MDRGSARRALVLIALACTLVACHDQTLPSPVDASGPDVPAGLSCGSGAAVHHAIGCACDSNVDTFCADYAGWCAANVCREFCSETAYPRCPDGENEQHETVSGRDVCVCS